MTLITQEVAYGSDPLQVLLITTSDSIEKADDAPVVCLFSGEGFRSSLGDFQKLASYGRQLANNGYVAVTVGYRDSETLPVGDPPIADQIADCVAGVEHVIDHAGTWGGDASRLSLMGGSAGGFLAAAACLALNAGGRVVSHCITLSGTTDFWTALAHWEAVGGKQGALHVGNITTALGTKTPTEAQCDAYSPARQVNPTNDSALWLLCNDTAEEQPLQQLDILITAIRDAGGSATSHVVTGTYHGWRTWAQDKATILAFLAS